MRIGRMDHFGHFQFHKATIHADSRYISLSQRTQSARVDDCPRFFLEQAKATLPGFDELAGVTALRALRLRTQSSH